MDLGGVIEGNGASMIKIHYMYEILKELVLFFKKYLWVTWRVIHSWEA